MTTSTSNNGGNNFDEILDRCLRAVESGQMSVEQCAARYPNYPELASLLRMAMSVRGLPRPQMSGAVTNQMQRRLQAQLREKARAVAPRRSPSFALRRLLLTFTVLVVILVGGGAGLVYAAANTLPGDLLYPVKRGSETVRLDLASQSDHANVLYDLAETRLNEIHGLAARGTTVQETWINDMYNSVDQAVGSQNDNGHRTQLATDAENALQDALSKGMISPALAQLTTQKLEVLLSIYVPNPPSGTTTPGVVIAATSITPTATFSATPTGTQSPTAVPSITLTPSFTASSTDTPAPLTNTPTLTRTSLPSATPTTTIPAPVLGPSDTPTLGRGPAVTVAGQPTRTATPTFTATETPFSTEAATESVTSTETATVTATVTDTATATDTPTSTPTNTPTVTVTDTPTTTPTNTATLTPTPNGLPSADLKQQPQEITFHDCKPEGSGGDPALNQLRNRIDEGRQYPTTAFDSIAGFPWPKDAEGKSRDQWSQQTKDAVAQAEGLPVMVEVYLAKVQDNGPEVQNCNSDFHTWQLWLLPNPGNDLSKALIASISPRVAANHAGWTLDKLNGLVGAKVRISGWILFNEEKAGDVGKSRVSLWEIHPVMQIAVQKGNQWVNLDDYQP